MEQQSTEAAAAPGTAGAGSAADGGAAAALALGRVYHDPSVPELVCRYPAEPVVTVLRTAPREVVVALQGREQRVAVRNGQLARVGRDYLMIRQGDDQGLWLLIEPGETLE
jgi:hypothetical protein